MVFLQLAILLPSSLCSYPRPKTCQAKVNGKWMVVQVLILCFVPEKRYNFALQEGEVVRVKGSTVEICEDGKIRTKHKSEVPQPLMLACGGENYKTVKKCVMSAEALCQFNYGFLKFSDQRNSAKELLKVRAMTLLQVVSGRDKLSALAMLFRFQITLASV